MCIGHISPEAPDGGLIAYVEDGDIIKINIPERTVILDVDSEIIENRKKMFKPIDNKPLKGYLSKYKKTVQSASLGAITK